MVRKIKVSRKDAARLKTLRVDPRMLKNDYVNYAGLVIRKPWGYEYLMFENEHVAVWVLYIQYGFQTSLHCHPSKKTSLTVLAGEALCTTLKEKISVRPGDGLLIDKAVFHSTRAVSPTGILVMETETPNNKRDLVRLDDKYGREHKGYEGKEHHVLLRDLEYADLHSFNELHERYDIEKKIGACRLAIVKHHNQQAFADFLRSIDATLVGILRGSLCNGRTPVFRHGDIVSASDLKQDKNICIVDEVELLIIKDS